MRTEVDIILSYPLVFLKAKCEGSPADFFAHELPEPGSLFARAILQFLHPAVVNLAYRLTADPVF